MIKKKLLFLALITMAPFLVFSTAGAIPSADLVYVETDIGGGWYQYDYTAYNTSDAGESLFDIGFWFDEAATFVWLNLPTGWDEGGPFMLGFEETWSTGILYDIAAGDSLSGYSFQIDYLAGDMEFDAFFDDGMGGLLYYTGVTREGDTPVIPEPSTLLLLGSGLTAIGYLRKKRKK